MVCTTSAVIAFNVWFGRIRSRSTSGVMPKRASTWSSISRCWPVAITNGVKRLGRCLRQRIKGASFSASGRVPTITATGQGPASLALSSDSTLIPSVS